MNNDRFERQIAMFGAAGQQRLRAAHVLVVGAGGVGQLVLQQLALLGVGVISIVEFDRLVLSNKNRLPAVHHEDKLGAPKGAIATRMIAAIDPSIEVQWIDASFVSERGYAAALAADWVIGCVDREGVRLILTEFCAAYVKPYLDISSEVDVGPPLQWGGRVFTALPSRPGCLLCLDELDRAEAAADLAGPAAREAKAQAYGVPIDAMEGSGPSVACINGVVASLGVAELMAAVIGLRNPHRLLRYRGHDGLVTVVRDEPPADCYCCNTQRGQGTAADVERYIRDGIGEWL